MIKYHQNGLGREYGEDHSLTNNWNPDSDYGNEYAKVHFRTEAKGFGYPSFFFTPEENCAFYNEVKTALQPLGWSEKNGEWGCGYIKNGKQTLYLHPQDFSGEVLKNDVKRIAEALEKHDTFYLRWVDLYKTVYDISDEEYKQYLDGKKQEITKILFDMCRTTRANKYIHSYSVCNAVSEKFELKRIDLDNSQTIQYVQNVVDEMIANGLLIGVENNGSQYIRSLNKTEQKKMKISVA